MTNHPLTNREQALVLISVIVISILFFPFTLLILLLLGGGLFLTKKNEDFSYLATAISIARGFLLLVIAVYACAAVYYGYLYYTYEQSEEGYYVLLAAYCSVIGLVTYFLLSQFILKPLRLHQEWVEKNGIFASRPNKEQTQKTKSIAITQSENLRSYSVADELLKWASLKDGGHISQEEYDEARRKLLHRAH